MPPVVRDAPVLLPTVAPALEVDGVLPSGPCCRCSPSRGYFLVDRTPTLTDKDTIVLADFDEQDR